MLCALGAPAASAPAVHRRGALVHRYRSWAAVGIPTAAQEDATARSRHHA